jgi:hypothetical protein
MSIFDKVNARNLTEAKDLVAKEQMTAEEVQAYKTMLSNQNRVNVYPNKFDKATPYRVAVRKGSEFKTHGLFTDVDVAAAVGTLCGIATYGDKAVRGNFDQAKAESHAEFQSWLNNPRNAAVLAAL